MVRRVTRIIVVTLGALLTVAGLIAAIMIGPGDRVGLGSEELTTDTAAMATPTSALNLVGPTLHVAATTDDGEVLVGAGHRMDVDAYLNGFAHELIIPGEGPTLVSISGDVEFPWQPTLEPVAGSEGDPSATPASRDWWLASASGPGEQTIEIELADDPLRVVVMRPDGSAPVAANVEFELEIENMFITTVIMAAIGVALILIGIFALRPRKAKRARAGRSSHDETVHL